MVLREAPKASQAVWGRFRELEAARLIWAPSTTAADMAELRAPLPSHDPAPAAAVRRHVALATNMLRTVAGSGAPRNDDMQGLSASSPTACRLRPLPERHLVPSGCRVRSTLARGHRSCMTGQRECRPDFPDGHLAQLCDGLLVLPHAPQSRYADRSGEFSVNRGGTVGRDVDDSVGDDVLSLTCSADAFSTTLPCPLDCGLSASSFSCVLRFAHTAEVKHCDHYSATRQDHTFDSFSKTLTVLASQHQSLIRN
jgi:hypothetical protein